jgi:hypothetical protein
MNLVDFFLKKWPILVQTKSSRVLIRVNKERREEENETQQPCNAMQCNADEGGRGSN